MKPVLKCKIYYYPSTHLSQIYDGFEKLNKKGIINVDFIRTKGNPIKPLLKVVVNDKYTLMYDLLDGLNWTEGNKQENLNFFKENIKADYYFKRSLNQQVLKHSPPECSVFPLGLNYPFQAEGEYPANFKESIKFKIKDSYIYSKIYKKTIFEDKNFEYLPIPMNKTKILFLTRLWDPRDVSTEIEKEDRRQLNKRRVACVKVCKKEFGDLATVGLQKNHFSRSYAPALCRSFSVTKREVFLQNIKNHNICVATTGLHGSIGWKFAEYVAGSRAIVTTPVNHILPGSFTEGKNYLSFDDESSFLNSIYNLLNNKELTTKLMKNNFQYYNSYLRSDMLVLNTLLKLPKFS